MAGGVEHQAHKAQAKAAAAGDVVGTKGSRFIPLLVIAAVIVIFLGVGMKLRKQEKLEFAPGDFYDHAALVEQLRDVKRPVDEYVWKRFSQESRDLLGAVANVSDHEARQTLASEFNRIIATSGTIHGETLFKNVELRPMTREAMAWEDPESEYANRLLLEDAYPNILTRQKWPHFHASDFTDPRVLVDKLTNSKRRPLDEYVWNGMSAESKESLEGPAPWSSAQHTLAAEFDKIVTGGNSVSDTLFELLGDDPDKRRKRVAAATEDGKTNHTSLNRRLLEDAYPRSIKKDESLSDTLRELGVGLVEGSASAAREFVKGAPNFVSAQLKTVSVLFLFAFIAGIFGLVYRRSFWPWFVPAFLILFLINYLGYTLGVGHITADYEPPHPDLAAAFLFLELLLLVLLVVFRLRRRAAKVSYEDTTYRRNIGLAFLALLAVPALVLLTNPDTAMKWVALIGGIAFLVYVAGSLLWQLFKPARSHPVNIVVCLDGTWNHPGQKDFGHLAQTNVFKLFNLLSGDKKSSDEHNYNASLFKRHSEEVDGERRDKQLGFYYYGVGNKVDNSVLGQTFGGAFGAGASAIVERAYLDVVREYQPGDRVFIFGFSRGAAIARLVAGTLGTRGIPKSLFTLRLLGREWTIWKSKQRLDAPSEKHPERESIKVDVLGCWDTVGAFGVAKNIMGIPFQKIDLLKDLTVSECVKRAYHMVALDETRDAFVPTLMDPDPTNDKRIVEVWFAGNHSNVGGGFFTDQLSDITLDFLLGHISSRYPRGRWAQDSNWGIYLKPQGEWDEDDALHPNEFGTIRVSTGPIYKHEPREVPVRGVIHDSVFDRMKDEDDRLCEVYAPQSVFDLAERVKQKRDALLKGAQCLRETESIDREEDVTRQQEELRVRRWKDWPTRAEPNPPEELCLACLGKSSGQCDKHCSSVAAAG